MPRPVIAVDIDDVLVPHAKLVTQQYNDIYGTRVELADHYQADAERWGAASWQEVVRRVNAIIAHPETLVGEPMEGAYAALKDLSAECNLVAITGRSVSTEKTTKLWLQDNYKDLFRDVIFTDYGAGSEFMSLKAEICKGLKAAVLVDDHLDHLVALDGVGIKGILFGRYPWNEADILPDGIERALNWHEAHKMLVRYVR